MSELLYAVDYTVNTVLTGCIYADGKVTLEGLTEDELIAKGKRVNWLNRKGFNPTNDPEQQGLSTTELTYIIDQLVAQDPNMDILALGGVQGKWIKYNHPDFMDKPSDV